MSMIQFEPRITTELPIDWQRPSSGQSADLFADLLADRLKQHAEADRRDHSPRRHQPPADPLPGRAPRVVVPHARTLRGEARAVEDTEQHVIDREPIPAEEAQGATPENATADEPVKTELEPAAKNQPSDIEAGDEASVADPVAAPTDDLDPALPAATVPVVLQQDQPASDDTAPEPVVAPAVPGPIQAEAASPVLVDEPAGSETEEGGTTSAVPQAVDTLIQTGLSDFAVALNAPTAEEPKAPVTAAPVVAAQHDKSPASTSGGGNLLPSAAAQASDAVPQFVPPPVKPRSEPPAPEAKPRPGVPHATAVRPDPMPASAATHAAQPQQPILPPQSGAGDLGGATDLPEHPLSGEGAGPGWMLHLAQGAVSRRADFVAQLRQHLQDVPAHEQVAVHIQRAMRDGTGRFSIQLSPAELGQIHVKLEIDEDKRVTASVTVERPSTLELLQRDIKGLERALHNAGLTMDGGDLSFSLGRGGDQGADRGTSHAAVLPADVLAPEGESAIAEPAGAAAQVMDTAAGMVDVQA